MKVRRLKSYLPSTVITSHTGFTFQVSAIRPNATFDTDFETGCRVCGPVDIYTGSFDALDSDDVLCSFDIHMVTKIY